MREQLMFTSNQIMTALLNGPNSFFKRASGLALTVVCTLALISCGGGEDTPTPPHIAGVWSGTWEGVESVLGPVSGTWESSISQNGTVVKGPISLGGDIDCAEGKMTGTADAESEIVSGDVFRDPCPSNNWLFTAFNEADNFASGEWQKQGLSNGAFEGRRIATFTGPRIKYVYPPGARAYDYVTIVGERLTMDPVNDSLTLGFDGIPLIPTTVSDTIITLQLPGNIADSDHLVLNNADGEALSPRFFNTDVTTPKIGSAQDIFLQTENLLPTGIAFSINGRRAFVANGGDGSVTMINSETGEEIISTVVLSGPTIPIPLHAVAVDPGGRRVYAAGNNLVGVLHAHTLELIRTLTVPANGSFQPNPQGIAVSPDGRWLLVSEAFDGGSVTIIDLENNFAVTDTLVMATGNTPRGIATGPDNTHAYIAVSGNDNEIWAYDLSSAMVDSKIVGVSPSAIAVTLDANRLYVTNGVANTVSYYDLDTGGSGEIDLGLGVSPTGLAVTPDGYNVFVTSSTNSVQVIDVLSLQVTPVDVGGASSGVTISPDGKRAYVAVPTNNKLVEIGNQRSLRISKQGGGIGVVTTSRGGIQCGNSCIATFDTGAEVQLIATPDSGSNSRFYGWSGDSGCNDGNVTINSNLFCVANFRVYVAPSGGSGSGSSNCFIATAAYGSWLDPQVLTLRQFRDQHLLTNAIGSWFVALYYRHSPPIADYIRDREILKAIVRSVLAVIIYAIEYPITAGFMLLLPLLISVRQTGRSLNRRVI
jgi:DNA-binding beta-propeller fold protein YncE